MAIVEPVEPAHKGRAHPGERPGQGPDKWPIRERFCKGEVRKSMWEGPTVPGILDGDVHVEIPKVILKLMAKTGGRGVWLGLRCVLLCSPAPPL